MKRLIITTLVCLFTMGAASTAKAVTLNPGGAIIPTNPTSWTPTGILQATTGWTGFTNAHYRGEVKQDVYLNGSGMLFVYGLKSYSSSTYAITRMTTSDFDSYSADVDALTPGELPNYITRSSPIGGTIGFQFNDSPSDGGFGGLGVEQNSATMYVQTNAKYYTTGQMTLQNGSVQTINGFAPTVPEPGTMMLLGTGILGLFGLRRRKA